MKVSQFGPELLEAFREATIRPIPLPPMPGKAATAFVYRMNSLRKAMRDEDHHYSPFAERVSITRVNNDDGTASLTISAADYQFADILARAGVTPPELPEEIADEEPDTEETSDETFPPSSQQALDEWLKKK